MPRVTRSPRNVKDRPSRWQLLLRRQKRLVRPAIWLIGGGAAVVFVVVLVRHADPGDRVSSLRETLGAMAPMHIEHVVFEGRANTPLPLLRAALGVSIGEPTLGFSVAAARQRIETLSWVKYATVERRLPGTIVVSLQEKRPFAIWQDQGKFSLIDRNGQVVAGQNLAAFKNLPLVVGPGAPAHATALLDALAKLPAIQAHVVAAVRVGRRRWNLQLDNGAQVLLPEGEADVALAELKKLQNQVDLLDRPLKIVDLRLPDRLVILPAAADAQQGRDGSGKPTGAGPEIGARTGSAKGART